MKTIKRKGNGVVLLLTVVLLSSCSTSDVGLSEKITINNNKTELSSRMVKMNEVIPVLTSQQGKKEVDFELVLKGELQPPSVEGSSLQATSVTRKANYLAVSYNYAGETYAGGIDLLTEDLELSSQAIFSDSDINDVEFYANTLYFAGGTSNESNPAFIGKLDFNPGSGSITQKSDATKQVGSYTANSVTEFGGVIYVTSGSESSNGGGVYRFDSGLGSSSYQPVQDARWIAGSGSEVYCLTGNPAELISMDRNNLNQKGMFPHEAQPLPESKMTMAIDKGMIFVAGGENGALIYDFNGNLISHLVFGDDCVTNAVSAENGRLFISNGEGGVYVASYKDEIEVIGKLELNSNESVNHILLHKDYLYVASGLGGVKMIEVVD